MSPQNPSCRKPSFLILGVQKAATTWLYGCLLEHPDIFIPKGKREVNYLGGPRYMDHGWDWWIGRFAGTSAGQIAGDVSVDYIYSRTAPQLIREKLGRPRLIVILRNPVERFISAYYWHLRRSLIPLMDINQGLQYALRPDETNGSAETGQIYKTLIERGFYDEQINHYLAYHDLNQFYFIHYEDIRKKPETVLKQVCEFLGLPECKPKVLHYQPKKNTYLPFLIRLERTFARSPRFSKWMDVMNFAASAFHLGKKPPSLNPPLRHQLQAIYQPHNQTLKGILQTYLQSGGRSCGQETEWIDVIEGWNRQGQEPQP